MIVAHGHRLDPQPVTLATEQRIGMRRRGDADRKPEALATEVGKPRRPVVDERPARQRQRRGGAGVRGGEDVQVVALHEPVELVLAQNALQRLARAVPSAYELLVAVRYAHLASRNRHRQDRGTIGQQLLEFGMLVDGDRKHLVDAVGPADRLVGRAVGVRATAADAHVHLAAQFRLDVAHQRNEGGAGVCDRPLELREVLGGLVEPVHIPVEDRQSLARLGGDHLLDRIERKGVPVQAARDVEHLARPLRRAGK